MIWPTSQERLKTTPACCAEWEEAHNDESDNEGVGPLIWYEDDSPAPRTGPVESLRGSPLEPLRFCPWCGEPKGEQHVFVNLQEPAA